MQFSIISAAITPAFSVTWSFRDYSIILIWCSRNIYIINVENSCVVSISVENYKKNYVQKAQ